MPAISKAVSGLYNGVSQQPDELMRDNQFIVQDNFVGTVSGGLEMRQGSKLMTSEVISADEQTYAFHTYQRDDDYGYTLMVSEGGIKVKAVTKFFEDDTDVTADERSGSCTVTDGTHTSVTDYLEVDTTGRYLADRIGFLTVGDTTYVYNRDVVPAMDSTIKTAARQRSVLVWVKASTDGLDYRLRIFTQHNSVEILKNAVNNDSMNLAEQLAILINAESAQDWNNDGANDTLSATLIGSTSYSSLIKISLIDSDGSTEIPFNVACSDGAGDTHLQSIVQQVDSIDRLPPFGPDGYKVQIAGVNAAPWYMMYSETDGRWIEELGWEQEYAFDASTMPLRVVRTGVKAFTVYYNTDHFQYRLTGDTESNPTPSFVGTAIEDMFVWKSRLGIVSTDAVTLSRTDDLTDFWKDSGSDLIDTDPIDVFISESSSRTTRCLYGVPYRDLLVIFTTGSQFQLSPGDGGITPTNILLDRVGSFETSTLHRPVLGDNRLFFTVSSGAFLHLYAFYVPDNALIGQSVNLSQHADRYIVKGSRRGDLVYDSTMQQVRILCREMLPERYLIGADYTQRDDPYQRGSEDVWRYAVYTYTFNYQGSELIQSCWSRETFCGYNSKNAICPAHINQLFERNLFVFWPMGTGLRYTVPVNISLGLRSPTRIAEGGFSGAAWDAGNYQFLIPDDATVPNQYYNRNTEATTGPIDCQINPEAYFKSYLAQGEDVYCPFFVGTKLLGDGWSDTDEDIPVRLACRWSFYTYTSDGFKTSIMFTADETEPYMERDVSGVWQMVNTPLTNMKYYRCDNDGDVTTDFTLPAYGDTQGEPGVNPDNDSLVWPWGWESTDDYDVDEFQVIVGFAVEGSLTLKRAYNSSYDHAAVINAYEFDVSNTVKLNAELLADTDTASTAPLPVKSYRPVVKQEYAQGETDRSVTGRFRVPVRSRVGSFLLKLKTYYPTRITTYGYTGYTTGYRRNSPLR